MKLVAISTIRNEMDILETFVRFHLQFVDHMIIVDHRSADSSSRILQSLIKEGLPLELTQENRMDFQQSLMMTDLMKKAVLDFGADWILPLDADEFLTSGGNGCIREVLEHLPQDKIVKVPWRTYIPLPSDNFQEPNTLVRIQHHRRTERQKLRKILIPRALAKQSKGMIAAGNHGFVKKVFGRQKQFPYVDTDTLVHAHFPVRSPQQIAIKVFVGWLTILVKPNKEPTEGFHLKLIYDSIKNGGQISPEDLTSMALGYATASGANTLTRKDLVHKPLMPETGDLTLRYTDTLTTNPLSILAQMAEEFAEALGAVRRKDFKEVNKNRLLSWMHAWRKK
jgi:hypothetical protein